MKRPDYRLPLAVFICCVTLMALIFVKAHAQSMGVGGQPASKFALQISDCPTATSGYVICPVVPLNGQPFIAMSVAGYNSGAPFAVASQGVAGPKGDKGDSITGPSGATGPQGVPGPVQSFGTLACPTTGAPPATTTGVGVVFGPGCKETNP
jgi:hypothetical protein